MESRREFLKKTSLFAGLVGVANVIPASLLKAMSIEPAAGSTYLDAEHIVFLMQENRSFDHAYGSLKGVRGFNDPRALQLANGNPVWFQTNRAGQTFAPFRLDIKNTKSTWMGSLPHSWMDMVAARNQGKMNSWLEAKKAGKTYAHMPLTMGYYDRKDLPFYYALADAFTICDQHFCSTLTGTSSNRTFFYIQKLVANLPAEIRHLESKQPKTADEEKQLAEKKENLLRAEEAAKIWNPQRFEALSDFEKSIHRKAFVTNVKDPNYHQVESIDFEDNGNKRQMTVPKGDVLYQFREDVRSGQLPMVSWLVAPCRFSDHPGSPWHGAWYISEVLDILTKNEEVWKKTIFVLTYDESDGYFDHQSPFVPPHSQRPYTGKTSASIRTETEFSGLDPKLPQQDNADSPVGLGFRVPMVIASPWSRGGYVNSQVFDHTSCLQFLEHFIAEKTGKKVEETNISSWRRSVCGDLSSVFRPADEKPVLDMHIDRNKFIESIYAAQHKPLPGNFKEIPAGELEEIRKTGIRDKYLPAQEPGVKPSNALPYQHDLNLMNKGKGTLEIQFSAGNGLFGSKSAAAAFQV